MNCFLDTNVKIGYVFCTDPWNDKSEHLFNMNHRFYISPSVKKEFNKKYNHILKNQKTFLYSLRNELNEENPSKKLSLKDLKIKSIIIELKRDFDENLKREIVEVLWKGCASKHEYDSKLKVDVCTIKDLLTYIKKFMRGFEGKLITRVTTFQREVIECEKRDKEYSDLNEKLLNAGIHYPDSEIILDAHDLSLKDNLILNFISADNEMIKNVNTVIGVLNIDKFYYLKEIC